MKKNSGFAAIERRERRYAYLVNRRLLKLDYGRVYYAKPIRLSAEMRSLLADQDRVRLSLECIHFLLEMGRVFGGVNLN